MKKPKETMFCWVDGRKTPIPPDLLKKHPLVLKNTIPGGPGAGMGSHKDAGPHKDPSLSHKDITDDPLAALEHRSVVKGPVYSVSRSVPPLLPRLPITKTPYALFSSVAGTLKRGSTDVGDGGINPLFQNTTESPPTDRPKTPRKTPERKPSSNTNPSNEKSSSSGYDSCCHLESNLDSIYAERLKCLKDDALHILEQNPHYVKSIRVAANHCHKHQKSSSGSSASGTLTTIPEGKDLPIPRPIWPDSDVRNYDSLVDEALLLYTSLNYRPDANKSLETIHVSVAELLVELLKSISATLEGKNAKTADEMLKLVNDKISISLDALKNNTEKDMKVLCTNLMNCKKVNSVLRAFGSASGESTQSSSSPEWSSSSNRLRKNTFSSENEDIYHLPSSSSSAFSDSLKHCQVHCPKKPLSNPSCTSSGVSCPNSCQSSACPHVNSNNNCACVVAKPNLGPVTGVANEKLIKDGPKPSLLRAVNDKPSVWEQYYGVKVEQPAKISQQVPKPTDVPVFPGGRPEADFTLDVPRSEHLTKKMREDKKWRCRCRLLTSFLGFVFFLLSVMAVSLMLTRGKRMFGSMV